MAARRRAAILPANLLDPVGTDKLERGAMREFARRMGRIATGCIDVLNSIPAEPVVNEAYVFDLDMALIDRIFAVMAGIIDEELLGEERSNWFLNQYVITAYQRGTGMAYMNLAHQSAVYESGRSSLIDLLRSRAYQRRVAMVRARVFEEMKGLSATVKADMSRVLADGVGRGLNPREIARSLRDQAGIETRRANRIARTEVSMALRRARWDEEEEARDDYGIKTMQLHLSALSPTTRPDHAARHAKLYTTDQVRQWWSEGANSINCKCGTTGVLVDDEGNPLVPAVVERAKETYRKMKAKGKGKWTN